MISSAPRYCVVNSTTAIAIDNPTANTVAVVDRTPIARSVPAKVMMMGVAVSSPNCASLMVSVLIDTKVAASCGAVARLTLRSIKE